MTSLLNARAARHVAVPHAAALAASKLRQCLAIALSARCSTARFTTPGFIDDAVHKYSLARFPSTRSVASRARRVAFALARSASLVQETVRAATARREGLERRYLFKPEASSILGLSFNPAFRVHAVIKLIKEGGLAQSVLAPGDLVARVDGHRCREPADVVRHQALQEL